MLYYGLLFRTLSYSTVLSYFFRCPLMETCIDSIWNSHFWYESGLISIWNARTDHKNAMRGAMDAQNISPVTPRWPRRRFKVTPGAPKERQRRPKGSPKAPPEPLKTIKKEVQNGPRRFFKKRSTPSCENIIIYSVFEGSLFENTIIYYVFVTSETLIFSEVTKTPLFTMFSLYPRNLS